jgi:outer membrane protein assembly factor BamB
MMRVSVSLRRLVMGLTLAVCGMLPSALAGQTPAERARQILKASGVRGGLVVHLGCGEGRLTAALGQGEGVWVHGLAADAKAVEAARKHIGAKGLEGKVAVERWGGVRLPYAENLVKLLVAEEPGEIGRAEMMRVLAPGGVLCTPSEGGWSTTVKPRPEAMDEWSHYLHDATGNAVAQDTLIGPPKRMQWISEPRYCRSHEIDSSISSAVSANGRLFYIHDEGLIGITDQRLPQTWALVARDAFTGIRLWKRPLPDWGWRQWKEGQLKGKDWTALRGQRTRSPSTLPRRLVAAGDRVYITLGYAAPVSVLDAATGETLRTCEGTAGTDEVLYSDGVLVLCQRAGRLNVAQRRGQTQADTVRAVKPETGEALWETDVGSVMNLCFAADGRRVVFHDGKALVGLDMKTGKQLWRTPADRKQVGRRGGNTLALHDGIVLFLGSKRLLALSARDGKKLWDAAGGRGPGVANPPDLFVASGLVWRGRHTDGLDPRTGEVKRKIDLKKVISPGHHFRCYRSKATEKYLLWPKRGVEFLDLSGDGQHMRYDWLRPPCKYGALPCNGLLYVPPHQCFCYTGVKMFGFNALASASESAPTRPEGNRLETGPAYADALVDAGQANAEDWPSYRHDARRTGAVDTTVAADLEDRWRVELGGRLSQPVVADGRLYVARIDARRIECLDAADGSRLWSFTAGGRVDSPPTIYRGRVLFGSADGWVYCLRARDGALAWRFRAAPQMRRIVAWGQLESAWPVHGSVLVKDGVVYCQAGRSTYLDGGIWLFGLDPKTGNLLHEGRAEGPWPDITKDVGRPFDMEGAFSDVLVTDGEDIFMQQLAFDSTLKQKEAPRVTNMGDRTFGRHVFSTAGFLDDSAWNRTFWMYSERFPGFYIANQAPKAGQLLVVGPDTTYAVKCYARRNRHSPMFFPGTDGYLLFADDNENEPVLMGKDGTPKPVKWLPKPHKAIGWTLTTPAVNRDKGTGFTRSRPPKWAEWVPVRIRAMVLAGDTLFAAGPPDVLDKDDPLAAFQGKKGARLLIVRAADGTTVAERKLGQPPVFDGMIAARGRVFIANRAGEVLCLGSERLTRAGR